MIPALHTSPRATAEGAGTARYAAYLILMVANMSACVTEVPAQPLRIMPVAGIESGGFLAIRRDIGITNPTPFPLNGRSGSVTYLLGCELSAPDLVAPGIDGHARLGLAFTRGWFNSAQFESRAAVHGSTGGTTASMNHLAIRSEQSFLQLEALLSHTLFDRVLLAGGAWARMRLVSTTVSEETIDTPATAIFPGLQTRSRTTTLSSDVEAFPLRAGLSGGIGYHWDISRHLMLRPIVGGRIDAEAFLNNQGARAFSLEFTLAAAFDLNPSLPPDTPMGPPPSLITARIDLFCQDSLQARRDIALIRRRTTTYYHYLPLPQAIFFNPDEETIASWYRSKEFVPTAHGGETQAMESDLAYRNVLNIIGERMQQNSSERLRIVFGSRTSDERARGRRRTEAVSAYLRSVWHIDPARISIAAKPSGAPTELRDAIVLEPSSVTLCGPWVEQWIHRDYVVPMIAYRKDIDSRYPLEKWRVEIRQGNRRVVLDTTDRDKLIDVTLSSVDPLPLVATLTATDSRGVADTATDELQLATGDSLRTITRVTRVYHLLPPHGSLADIEAINQLFIEDIVENSSSHSRILVSGAGNPGRNWSAAIAAQRLLQELNRRGKGVPDMRIVSEKPNRPGLDGPAGSLFTGATLITIEQ